MDWAEPEKDVDEEVMQRVRVLYVRTHTQTHTNIFITFLFSLFVSSVVSTGLKVKGNLEKFQGTMLSNKSYENTESCPMYALLRHNEVNML